MCSLSREISDISEPFSDLFYEICNVRKTYSLTSTPSALLYMCWVILTA